MYVKQNLCPADPMPFPPATKDEISQVLSQSLNEADDADVMAEMEALEEEGMRSEMEAMPTVPQTRPVQATVKPKADIKVSRQLEDESKLQPMLAS